VEQDGYAGFLFQSAAQAICGANVGLAVSRAAWRRDVRRGISMNIENLGWRKPQKVAGHDQASRL
jgi:hypothetical protein